MYDQLNQLEVWEFEIRTYGISVVAAFVERWAQHRQLQADVVLARDVRDAWIDLLALPPLEVA